MTTDDNPIEEEWIEWFTRAFGNQVVDADTRAAMEMAFFMGVASAGYVMRRHGNQPIAEALSRHLDRIEGHPLLTKAAAAR